MTEVEKLYSLAGVNKHPKIMLDEDAGVTVQSLNEYYPPFTAEKQIELIKWFGKLTGKLEISCNYNYEQYLAYFYLNRKTRDEILPNISTGRNENFAECLANLINNLWQDLTAEEQEQIREILK